MLTPKENPDGYDEVGCVGGREEPARQAADRPRPDGRQRPRAEHVQFVDALQRADKEFEMMVYPQSRHGIGGQHYTRLQTDFIRRTMGVEGEGYGCRSPPM